MASHGCNRKEPRHREQYKFKIYSWTCWTQISVLSYCPQVDCTKFCMTKMNCIMGRCCGSIFIWLRTKRNLVWYTSTNPVVTKRTYCKPHIPLTTHKTNEFPTMRRSNTQANQLTPLPRTERRRQAGTGTTDCMSVAKNPPVGYTCTSPSLPKQIKLNYDHSINAQGLLPVEYVPDKFDVLCARGKKHFNHVGNRRFRLIIAMNIEKYIASGSKIRKSLVVASIVDSIKEARPDEGGFIHEVPSLNRWRQLSDAQAREKVGHALRDAVKNRRKEEQSQRTKDDRNGPERMNDDDKTQTPTLLEASQHRGCNQLDSSPSLHLEQSRFCSSRNRSSAPRATDKHNKQKARDSQVLQASCSLYNSASHASLLPPHCSDLDSLEIETELSFLDNEFVPSSHEN